MKFEEEFPSLKGIIWNMSVPGKGVSTEDIQKHCLDKKRVSNAVEKADELCYEQEDIKIDEDTLNLFQRLLRKELGLE